MRTPESVLAEMDALFPEPPDLSILGDPDVPIDEQMAYAKEIAQRNQGVFGNPSEPMKWPINQLVQELGQVGTENVSLLIEMLVHRKPMMRGFVALSLSMAGMFFYTCEGKPHGQDYHLATDALLKQFEAEKNNQAKGMMICALGQMKDKRAIQPLLELLQSPIEFFRSKDESNITALERMKNLKTLLEDEQFNARSSVVMALGNLEDKQVARHLMQLMDTDLSDELGGLFSHRNAAEILAKWGIKEAIEPIRRCLARYQASELETEQRSNQYVCPHLEMAITKLETSTEGGV
jgi:HEAT repeat protein